MRTIQMTLDDDLVRAVDKAARALKTSRSGFTRRALHQALLQIETLELERKHREGYKVRPVKPNEFSKWEKEQVWSDE